MRVEKIKLKSIEVDENQPRKSFENLGDLGASILKNGLIEPIKVEKVGDIYKLIDGERRLRAFSKLAKVGKEFEEIDCIVLNEFHNKLVLQLVTDIQKDKLDHLEEGEAFKRLVEQDGLTTQEIATLIGKKRPYIHKKLKLTCFNDATKSLIRSGRLPSASLYSLDMDKAKIAENVIVARIMEERPTLQEVRKIVIEETDDVYSFIGHFICSFDDFKSKLIQFEKRCKQIGNFEINFTNGERLGDCMKRLNRFTKEIKVIRTIEEDVNKKRGELEALIETYGKGAYMEKLKEIIDKAD